MLDDPTATVDELVDELLRYGSIRLTRRTRKGAPVYLLRCHTARARAQGATPTRAVRHILAAIAAADTQPLPRPAPKD